MDNELSVYQEEIVETNKSKVIVLACAASGKTYTMTERVKYLLRNGVDPANIVVITFTNMAAGEMRKRIGDYPNLFIGTVHSYAATLLSRNGERSSVVDAVSNEQFDDMFEKLRTCAIPKIEYLLLDEAQDSTPAQFEFIFDCLKPENWMLFGDFRQSLYTFSGASPEQLIDLSHQRDVSVFTLEENFRNSRKILQYAKKIIAPLGMDYVDLSVAMRDNVGKVDSIQLDYPTLLALILRENEAHKRRWRDWMIICRSNAQIMEISEFFGDNHIPYDTFKVSDFTMETLKNKMQEDTIKILTIHSAKGLEAPCVAVIGAQYFNTDERCVSYVAATRARDYLIWCKKKQKPPRNRNKFANWG